jgi:hypothetical protein
MIDAAIFNRDGVCVGIEEWWEGCSVVSFQLHGGE